MTHARAPNSLYTHNSACVRVLSVCIPQCECVCTHDAMRRIRFFRCVLACHFSQYNMHVRVCMWACVHAFARTSYIDVFTGATFAFGKTGSGRTHTMMTPPPSPTPTWLRLPGPADKHKPDVLGKIRCIRVCANSFSSAPNMFAKLCAMQIRCV